MDLYAGPSHLGGVCGTESLEKGGGEKANRCWPMWRPPWPAPWSPTTVSDTGARVGIDLYAGASHWRVYAEPSHLIYSLR
jgi:hypothetical protein